MFSNDKPANQYSVEFLRLRFNWLNADVRNIRYRGRHPFGVDRKTRCDRKIVVFHWGGCHRRGDVINIDLTQSHRHAEVCTGVLPRRPSRPDEALSQNKFDWVIYSVDSNSIRKFCALFTGISSGKFLNNPLPPYPPWWRGVMLMTMMMQMGGGWGNWVIKIGRVGTHKTLPIYVEKKLISIR